MTKNDLISAIAEKGGYSKKEAEQLRKVRWTIPVKIFACLLE